MPTTGLPAEVERYLAAVRATLADLAPEERDDLLGDVEASLLEAAGEVDGTLEARLGPPEEFAAELRASAGLAPPPALPPAAPAPDPWRMALRRAWRSPQAGGARRGLRDLAPIWWALRGYLVLAALATSGLVAWSVRNPALPRVDGPAVSLAVVGLAVAASVALGLLVRRAGAAVRVAAAILDVALLLAAIPVAGDLLDSARPAAPEQIVAIAPEPSPVAGLAYDGVPVRNVYAYDREGNPLFDVLLYDEGGRPLDLMAFDGDPSRRVVFDALERPLWNVVPIRYYEPGTSIVAEPTAAPVVPLPEILTPPLEAAFPTG